MFVIYEKSLTDISGLAHKIETYLEQHGKELTGAACTAACDVMTDGIAISLCGVACSL